MLRIANRLKCQVQLRRASESTMSGVQRMYEAGNQISSKVANPRLDSLSRYIPTEARGFLVEDHRLTTSEKASQRVSSVIPWIVLGVLTVSPFLVMQYNLQRLSSTPVNAVSGEETKNKVPRYAFRRMGFADVPELLSRRFQTFVFAFDDSFHSQVLFFLIKELDQILSSHGIDISVCAVDLGTADSKFRSRYPHGPVGHLIEPKDQSLMDFVGRWSARSVVEFLLPESKITPEMQSDLIRLEERTGDFRRCLFRERFINQKGSSSSSIDIDTAIARCAPS